jgi:hypothetical protein
MNLKCYFQYDDGRFCKNWAMRGTRFCNNHQPPDADAAVVEQVVIGLPPIHLKEPRDLLQLVADALNGLRTGSMAPGRGYAISCLGKLWLDLHSRVKREASSAALDREIQAAVSEALGHPILPDATLNPELPPPPAAALVPPTPPPRDPWAAGRMAGPVPPESTVKPPPPAEFPELLPDARINREHTHLDATFSPSAPGGAGLPRRRVTSESTPDMPRLPRQPTRRDFQQPIHLEDACAKLSELLDWKPDAPDQPLTPRDTARAKPNPSAAARASAKSRDPAA